MWSFICAVGSSGGDDEGHCWSQLGGYCLTGLWVLCRLKGWAVLEQSKCLFSAKQGENTWLSIVDWHKDDCGCYECILCADMGFLCSWDCPWESLGKSLTVSLSQKGEELPSPSPEEEAGTLVLQHAGFPGDLVTLFELLIPLKREDIGKHSLIPTAERRKGACNCLCFLPCWAEKFALCMLGNLISPWAWLKGGYCNLLVAQGKARYVTLLLRSTGWYSPCLPPSHALGRALWLTVIAGAETGWGWICTLVCRAWGSAWHWCYLSNHEPSESPWQVSKKDSVPASKWQPWAILEQGSCLGVGDPPGELLHFPAFTCRCLLLKDLSCKRDGRTQTCSTGLSEVAASFSKRTGFFQSWDCPEKSESLPQITLICFYCFTVCDECVSWILILN